MRSPYTHGIRALRVLLPLATAALAGVLITTAAPPPSLGPLLTPTQQAGRPGLITGPRFLGIDAQQQPFQLAALSAQQQKGGDFSLEGLSGEATLESGQRASLKANRAYYNHTDRKVYLEGRIQLADGRGYALDVRDLAVDVAHKRAMSTGAVTGSTPDGAINAGGLDITDAGKRVVFHGASTISLRGGAATGKTTPLPIIRLQ